MTNPLKVHLVRELAAPREAVFEAWLDPELLGAFLKPAPGVIVVDLDADGKHYGYIRIQFSSDRSAYGWLPVPIMSIKSGEGPCATIIGANHGDEYEGVSIANELYQTLGTDDITGQIIFLPAANAPAYHAGRRTSPLDHTGEANLNRLFPGQSINSTEPAPGTHKTWSRSI